MKNYFVLNNGIRMPVIGLGTFLLTPLEAENSVKLALKDGYCLIDTANAYFNERAVGRGIRDSKIIRKDIFISTKIWPSEYENKNAIEETLERLNLDYLDLLFLHQPAGNWQYAYKMLEKAYREGKIKAIGISNFEGKYLEELLEICEIIPQVIQVECHPYFPQKDLRERTKEKNIRIMSWYPLGGKENTQKLLSEPIVNRIAVNKHKTSAQIILKWHIQMGFVVIPGSKNERHIKENLDIFDFELSDDEMNQLAELNQNYRFFPREEEDLKTFPSWKLEYEAK